MAAAGYALFETALGRCGIAWRGRAIVGTCLPGGSERSMRERLARRCGADGVEAKPSAAAASAAEAVVALLAGENRDLAGITIDLGTASELEQRVYRAARTIRPGETLTYGEVARRIGEPAAAREVGAALGRNPIPIIVPCHRVLAASGGTGGFSAPGGVTTKMQLLSIEARHAPQGLFGSLPLAAKPRATEGAG